MSARNKEERRQIALNVLYGERGFLAGLVVIANPRLREVAIDRIRAVDSGISALLDANMMHDAGANARCSYCGRYSAHPSSINDGKYLCDCGKADGWSGSFVPPGDDAQWSLGLWRPAPEGANE